MNHKISRRKAVSTAAAVGAAVGVGVVAGAAGFFIGSSAPREQKTVTLTNQATLTQTQTVTASKLPGEIKIGVLLPLSGDIGPIGSKMLNGAKLAAKLLNNWGGIAGSTVSIAAEDTVGEPTKALDAVKKLVEVDGVQVIAGPATSVEFLTIAEYLKSRNVPAISMSATAAAISEIGGDYIFRVVPSDAEQTRALADLITSKGVNRLATFVVSNDYGIGIETGLKKHLGNKIVLSIRYDPTKGDYREELNRVKQANVDAVLWAMWVDSGIVVFKQAYDLGLTNILSFGGEGMSDKAFFADAKAAEYLLLTKMTGTKPAPPAESLSSKKFVEAYRKEFGEDPGLFADTTYDSTMVSALAVALAGEYKGAKIASMIKTAAYHYIGPSGQKMMNASGDAEQASYEIWRIVKDGEYGFKKIGSWDSVTGINLTS
ncbi:MAG: ABC transporter substrate-binding protein [Candidatus Caldarchaeum sp.]|jgi:ABC-type branched-subunit amino acid transport system substrate-binding protein|nr:ABC transporter substrate-binding protein [Candidatus Caldarchaeales archaeon]